MNKMKTFLLTVVLSVGACSAVIYTSCNKATCVSSTTCENGGTCKGGDCTCPVGFTGAFCQTKANSVLRYVNNTFTPVTISVNGSTQNIPVGGKVAFVGQAGTVANGSASTSGAAGSLGVDNSGGILGLTINWDIDTTFPNMDTLDIPLNVGASYFYLYIVNTGTASILDFYVNYEFSYGQVYQDITVPNNSVTYGVGYYLAYSSSSVQVQRSDSKVIWQAVTVPFTSNQSYTAKF